MQKNTITALLLGLLTLVTPSAYGWGPSYVTYHYYSKPSLPQPPTVFDNCLSTVAGTVCAVSGAYGVYHLARALKYAFISTSINDEREEKVREERNESLGKGFGALGVGLVTGAIAQHPREASIVALYSLLFVPDLIVHACLRKY